MGKPRLPCKDQAVRAGAKAGKVVGALVDKEDRVEEVRQMKEVWETMRTDRNKIRQIYAVSRLDKVAKKTANCFDNKYLNKHLANVPVDHLVNKWLLLSLA